MYGIRIADCTLKIFKHTNGTDLHGTLAQLDHLKQHHVLHAVFLVVSIHAAATSALAYCPFAPLTRGFLPLLRLGERTGVKLNTLPRLNDHPNQPFILRPTR